MNQVRILALLLLLLSGNSFGFTIPSEIDPGSLEQEKEYNFSENFRELSYSNLVSPLDLFTKRSPDTSTTVVVFENSRENSRCKNYFSTSYLIEPGLGLQEIIFPFHTFL